MSQARRATRREVTLAVLIDGEPCAAADARVSVFDRGFLYGDSVFETIRTYAGRPFALDEHLDRLARSAAMVYIPLPCSREQLTQEIERAIRLAGHDESYVRVMITRGQGELGLDPALAELPLRVIIAGELKPPAPELYTQGASAVTFKTLRPSDATLAEGAKIGNYLVAVLAMREARKHGAHEALIVDRAGCVVEGASSNIFFVREGILCTPPEDAGILSGITRRCALLAASDLGLQVQFVLPSIDELKAASEVFVSSSIRELLPIVRIDGSPINDASVGPMTRGLIDQFKQVVARLMQP